MFSKDRDLVVHEPGLMRDVGWAGQRRLSVLGSVNGTQLTISSGSFLDSGVEAGHVVVFDGVTLEVVSVDSASVATVSLLRGDITGSAVPPISASNRGVVVHDFSAQRTIVHRQVLTMLGVDAAGESGLGIDESMVTNPGALTRLESLGTLHLIYAGASAPGRAADRYEQRAELYRQRYQRERESVVAMIDIDGDGIAESTRRPNAIVLSRG